MSLGFHLWQNMVDYRIPRSEIGSGVSQSAHMTASVFLSRFQGQLRFRRIWNACRKFWAQSSVSDAFADPNPPHQPGLEKCRLLHHIWVVWGGSCFEFHQVQ